jgi:hypothetical protein
VFSSWRWVFCRVNNSNDSNNRDDDVNNGKIELSIRWVSSKDLRLYLPTIIDTIETNEGKNKDKQYDNQ